jgi:hypothetical protein
MDEIAQFIAMSFDLTSDGVFAAGEPLKCATPTSAIEQARGLWRTLGHAGAVAFVRTGYPVSEITVLRKFGTVPDQLPN